MIKITSDFRGDELVNRREALLRLDGLLGMDGSSRMADMLETLVKAVNQARINETGSGYSQHSIDTLLAKIRKGQLDAIQRDRKVTGSNVQPVGVERIVYPDGGTRSTTDPATPKVHATSGAHTPPTAP